MAHYHKQTHDYKGRITIYMIILSVVKCILSRGRTQHNTRATDLPSNPIYCINHVNHDKHYTHTYNQYVTTHVFIMIGYHVSIKSY